MDDRTARTAHHATDVFGDASSLLGPVTTAGAHTAAGSPLVTFGAFRTPGRGWRQRWRLRALRRRACAQSLRSVVRVGPDAAVIALDAPAGANIARLRAAGARLARDLPYISEIRYGHRLPTVVVIVRGHKGRERLLANLHRGLFHHADAFREVLIDAEDLPCPDEPDPLLPQPERAALPERAAAPPGQPAAPLR